VMIDGRGGAPLPRPGPKFMLCCPLRLSLRLTATYAIICLLWVGFAHWVAPKIIVAAYEEGNLSILNWVFQGRLPVERYLNRWSVIAAAALLAAVLHLIIVLFIYSIDRKHRGAFLDAASHDNTALVVFSAAFLALAVVGGAQGDYKDYLLEWKAVLAGDPWRPYGLNAYGPLFNVLAPLAWLNPLANKLLFALAYLLYIIWLIKDFAPRQGFVALSRPWVGLWLLNPFPWEQIAWFGYFDVLVALACVAAVHSLVTSKDGASGTYLALGILLKYMPIVILPFLVFSKRLFHFRLLTFCVGVVILGLIVSVLAWGTSTFLPLRFAATRAPKWSIYTVLASTHSPLQSFLDSPNVDWLEKPLLLIAGLAMFTWCILRQIEAALSSALAILVTLLFYRIGYANYQMVLFLLISYWVVSDQKKFKEPSVLAALLVGYFGFLAIVDFDFWSGLFLPTSIQSSIKFLFVLIQFLLGCALLVGLIRVRPHHAQSATERRPVG
jgi:Glycosyltransferase family 87